MSASSTGVPNTGLDWFAVLELLGLWVGAIGTVGATVVALWLASRRLRPAIHCRPSLVTRGPLQKTTWQVDLSNRTPIGVRLVSGEWYWLAPTWRRPWARDTIIAHLVSVGANDRENNLADAFDSYPVKLAGYEAAQIWVVCPTPPDFTKGPRLRRWLAFRSLRLLFQNATGERFIVRAPKGWEREAPKDPDG